MKPKEILLIGIITAAVFGVFRWRAPILFDLSSAKALGKSEARPLSAEETLKSEQAVLDQTITGVQRREELTALLEHTPATTENLVRIASSPMPEFPNALQPHSSDETLSNFERSLRVTALERLDQLGIESPRLKTEIAKILEAQKNDPTLSFLATVSLQGFEQGQPGKLSRFIAKAFAQFESQKPE
jgi:hypothetical protein